MSIVTTNRVIDLPQLGTELATAAGLAEPPGLSATTTETSVGTETVVRCDHDAVTQQILDDVIDAHTPAAPAPTDAEQIVALKARLADTQAALDEVIIGALMGEFPPI